MAVGLLQLLLRADDFHHQFTLSCTSSDFFLLTMAPRVKEESKWLNVERERERDDEADQV